MSSSQAASNSRLRLVSFGAAAFFGLALYSQARVQTFGSNDVKKKALDSKRFVVTQVDLPKRGLIMSSDGKILARDEGVYALHVNFAKVPKSTGFYLDLAEATDMSGADIRQMADRAKGDVLWPATLTPEQKKKVDAVKTRWRADGLSADPTGKRQYSIGSAGAPIVGLFGKTGIEKALLEELSGSRGVARGLVDRTGAFLPMRMEDDNVRRVDGQDVQLTIDSSLQMAAFDAVKRAVESNKARSGVAIVMDPKTGDLLAMVNWPTFDPATGQGPDGKPADFNPNIMEYLEPGSTMKILTLAKAIEDQRVTPGWTWNCGGALVKGPYRIQCDAHHGNRAHGTLGLEKAIAVSCNVSAAQWACEIGFEPYHKFIQDLGLIEKPVLELPGVKGGSLFIEPVAKTHELMCWGFGQSMGVTPLALASAFTALGNDGVWMKPRLVKSVGGKERPVQEGQAVFSSETSQQVMRYMETVIDSNRGTGKSLRIPGYRTAGKTGTAERKGRVGGGYVANFVGFIPAEAPKAMILVMIDHPTTGRYYGATVAGPVYLDIAHAVIRKFGLKPSSGTPIGVETPVKPVVDVEVKPQASTGR